METEAPYPHCSRTDMAVNVGLQALALLMSFPVLLKKPRTLFLWIVGWALNLTVFRFNTCMNCDYYGRECHLGWGVLTSRMFERKSEPDRDVFRNRFPVNVAFLFTLFLMPVGAMRRNRALLAAYLAVLIAMNVRIPLACRSCSMNDVCPMGERVKRMLDRG